MRKERKSAKQLVEQLQKHGVHAELVKRPNWAMPQQTERRGQSPVQ
ncbi:hypothetical protein [Anoxybacteroides amylolyticum]|uniref:Uncharacterized protein n=1 Tax=Anoxybacteroides amylolyticum TaxID=294699 RepID=A0A160F383_9BACL|nr:hypothetical protein [Anoxybacillus amylolyticus]ANB60401.1 hypothetical protein GFC30_422 [Anoxybacillus amylolyticus]